MKNTKIVINTKSKSYPIYLGDGILNKRVKWNQKRPLLKEAINQKKLTELYAERKDIYKLANHKIVCDKLSKENIAEKIIALYEKY